jgi:2-polyprenyl-3-methyl-5-hydroxy-6-metoxy-1,4-benzoquinol methylase
MKTKIKEYKDRGIFANQMLDHYFTTAPNTIVSDIGAGFGFMQKKVESIGGTWQPFDYVKKIEESIIWDLNQSCPNEATQAGTVLFLEVLEHLANPLLCLQNISKHMEKNGVLILTTPNPSSSKNTLSLFLKGRLYAFQEKHLREHHVFTPWEHIVQFFLENCGFEILEYCIVDTSYKMDKSVNLKDFVKRRIEHFIEYRNPKAKGFSYGIVARKVK